RKLSANTWRSGPPTPTGLRRKAQGCEARATLGHRPQIISNRNAVAASPRNHCARQFATTALRLMICSTLTQGRRWGANLGLEVAIPLGLSAGNVFLLFLSHLSLFGDRRCVANELFWPSP